MTRRTMSQMKYRTQRILGGLASLCLLISLAGLACTTDRDGAAPAQPAAVDELPSLLFSSKEGEAVVKAGDHVLLTVEDLRRKVEQQSPFMRSRLDTPEGRRELVDQLVQFELLAREAARQEMHLDPQVQQALKRAMVNQLLSRRLQRPDASFEVPEERVRAYYEENISEFVQPERVRVSHIFFAAEEDEQRDEARAKAEERLAELQGSGRDNATAFSRLARQASEDVDSRSIGGDLRYQSKDQLTEAWGARMAEASFALERVGSVSEVIEGDRGFHILRLVGRQRATDRKLEDVRPQLMNRLRREERNRRFDAFVDEIKEKESLWLDEELLEQIELTGTSAAQKAPAKAAPPAPEGN